MKKYLKISAIIIFVIIVLIAAGLYGIKFYFKMSIDGRLSAEQKKLLENFRTKRFSLREIEKENAAAVSSSDKTTIENTNENSASNNSAANSSLNSAENKSPEGEEINPLITFTPFSQETVNYAKQFYSGMDTEILKKIPYPTDYNEDFTSETIAGLEKLGGSIALLQKAINQPDYNADLWGEDFGQEKRNYLYITDFELLNRNKNLLCLFAQKKIKEGKTNEAIAAAESIIKSCKIKKETSTNIRYYVKRIFINGCDVYYNAVKDCDSTETLTAAFEKLKSLESYSIINELSVPVEIIDELEVLRAANRYGIKCGSIEGLTYEEICALSFRIQADYLEKTISSDSIANQDKINHLKDNARSFRIFNAALGGETNKMSYSLIKVFSPFVKDAFVANFLTPRIHAKKYELQSDLLSTKTYYNLLKTEIALKLYELKHGKKPDDLSELVGEYLFVIPFDEYSANYETIKYKNFKPYSVGPDKKDDKCAVLYDVINYKSWEGDLYYK